MSIREPLLPWRSLRSKRCGDRPASHRQDRRFAVWSARDAPHALEHALEVELPFLQTILPAFTLVPLVVGEAAPQDVATVLGELWGADETAKGHSRRFGCPRRRSAITRYLPES